jgi:outer membrane biosynthesis protein TonB
MMKVLFLATREGRRGVFDAGKVYDLPMDSAAFWMARGVVSTDPAAIARALAEQERAVQPEPEPVEEPVVEPGPEPEPEPEPVEELPVGRPAYTGRRRR